MGPDQIPPMFSRAIVGGKKTAKMEARVSEQLKEDSRRTWHDLGFASESEWLETIVTVSVYGAEHVRMVQEKRLRMVCGMSDIAPTFAGQGARS